MNEKLKLTPQIIIPSMGELVMDCGNCKGRVFNVHITPHPNGAGKPTSFICATCKRVFRLDGGGFVEGGGSISAPSLGLRGNGRR